MSNLADLTAIVIVNPCEPDPGVWDHAYEYRDGIWFCSVCGEENPHIDPPERNERKAEEDHYAGRDRPW